MNTRTRCWSTSTSTSTTPITSTCTMNRYRLTGNIATVIDMRPCPTRTHISPTRIIVTIIEPTGALYITCMSLE
jgi:hypothetical protein